MTRITSADQVLLLLRAQLDRAEKAKRKSPNRPGAKASKHNAIERLRAVAANGDIPEEDLSRALVSALLVEEFGEDALNQQPFQDLVTQVAEAIASDESATTLLRKAVTTLRGQ